MNHMTNDPPDGDSLRPSSAAAGPADRGYRPWAMLRAVDAKTRPDLKRAIPAALLTLLSFQFGEGLGGIRRTTPAFFNLFGGTFEVPTPYVKRRRRAALRNGSGSPVRSNRRSPFSVIGAQIFDAGPDDRPAPRGAGSSRRSGRSSLIMQLAGGGVGLPVRRRTQCLVLANQPEMSRVV